MAKLTPDAMAKSGTEFGEQSALFCWASMRETREAFPDAFKLYANNNNAGLGDAVRGARAKMAGVRSGVADVFLPVPRHGRAGLYIELKIDPEHPQNQRVSKTTGKPLAPKRGELSDEQIAFGRQVQADGFGWVCCHGWKAAADVIRQYLAPSA